MQSRGLIGVEVSLTPCEQDVQQLLLTSLTEEEIGVKLGLTPRTTHQYDDPRRTEVSEGCG